MDMTSRRRALKDNLRASPLVVGCLAALALPPHGVALAQQTVDRQFTHTLLAPGIAASAPATVRLRTVPVRLVLRNLVVGQGTAKDVANSSFAVMELQAGHVVTTIAGDRQERVPGDFWTVAKGANITFENPHPNAAAIIRVTSVEATP
jgi:hypothetical protein